MGACSQTSSNVEIIWNSRTCVPIFLGMVVVWKLNGVAIRMKGIVQDLQRKLLETFLVGGHFRGIWENECLRLYFGKLFFPRFYLDSVSADAELSKNNSDQITNSHKRKYNKQLQYMKWKPSLFVFVSFLIKIHQETINIKLSNIRQTNIYCKYYMAIKFKFRF